MENEKTKKPADRSVKPGKIGLVLEGGAMRGIYTAGVLDVFMEHGITFDGVIGVSAGAIHGSSYVSGQKGRSLRYYLKYRNDKHFMSLRSFLRTGSIADEKFCYHEIPERLDPYDYEAFYRSPMKFYAGCTNLVTGGAEYEEITDMLNEIDAVRASSSMPYVSRIVHYKGKKLLDGGCADSIPVRAFRRMGYRWNVVVLTREDGYRKEPEKARMAEVAYHKYPEFVKTLKNRHKVYNRTLKEIHALEDRDEIFVIRPSIKLTIGRMERDPKLIRETYEIGRRDTEKKLDELQKWLQERSE
jgi:predicted patatin/cPLA2 family phospholipase